MRPFVKLIHHLKTLPSPYDVLIFDFTLQRYHLRQPITHHVYEIRSLTHW